MRKKTLWVLLISAMVLVIIGVNISNTYALDAISTITSANSVKKGETITVKVGISNIPAGGVNAIQGTITYDNTKLTLNSVSSENNWDKPEYNANNGKFVTTNGSFITEAEDFMTLTFTANEVGTNVNISITNLIAAKSDDTRLEIEGISKNIEVITATETPITPEKTLTGITLTKPTKTSYNTGDTLSTTGMKTIANYSDETTQDVTNSAAYYFDGAQQFSLSGIILTKGTHTIKVAYQGYEKSFTVTAIDVVTNPENTTEPENTTNLENANKSENKANNNLNGIVINTNTTENKTSNTNDVTTSNAQLSNTGRNEVIVPAVATLAALAIFFYIRYKRYDMI